MLELNKDIDIVPENQGTLTGNGSSREISPKLPNKKLTARFRQDTEHSKTASYLKVGSEQEITAMPSLNDFPEIKNNNETYYNQEVTFMIEEPSKKVLSGQFGISDSKHISSFE